MQNETSVVAENPSSTNNNKQKAEEADEKNSESDTENKTEEPWIALIEKEVEEISFKNGQYKIIPTNKEDIFEIANVELENGIEFHATLVPKNYPESLPPLLTPSPEAFQEKAKAVLTASSLPEHLKNSKWAVDINGHKFQKSIVFLYFAPYDCLFDVRYYTTTPMYTLCCSFYRDADEFKQEVPQYFEENGKWIIEMPSGENCFTEFAKKNS